MKLLPMTVVFVMWILPMSATAQTVYVTEASGKETKGRIVSWTDSTIVLKTDVSTMSFAESEVARIDLKGDSLKNGALIGAGVGAALGGLLSGIMDCENCGAARVTATLVNIGMYAAVGTAFDALISGRTLLWRAGSSARHGSGLVVNVSPQRRSAFVGFALKRR